MRSIGLSVVSSRRCAADNRWLRSHCVTVVPLIILKRRVKLAPACSRSGRELVKAQTGGLGMRDGPVERLAEQIPANRLQQRLFDDDGAYCRRIGKAPPPGAGPVIRHLGAVITPQQVEGSSSM